MKRGEFFLGVLEILGNFAITTGELIDAMTSGYAESYKKLKRIDSWSSPAKLKFAKLIDEMRADYKRKEKFYDLVYRLSKDELIISNKNGRWRLTRKGTKKLDNLERLFKEQYKYKPEKSDQLLIVAFDIPEKEKRKRDWLRWVLKNLGLKMLQKSVWIGKIKLPQEFLDDLERERLLQHIEILAVTKSGTIKHLA